MDGIEKPLTIKDVAKILGKSQHTIQNYVKSGILRARVVYNTDNTTSNKQKGTYFFKKEWISDFMQGSELPVNYADSLIVRVTELENNIIRLEKKIELLTSGKDTDTDTVPVIKDVTSGTETETDDVTSATETKKKRKH